MKELNLKNDIVFKAFFAKKGNEKFLKSFLEALLEVEIRKIEIVGESSLLQLSKTEKLGRLDIKATIDNEKIINIEMQVEKDENMGKRSVFYGCSLIREQVGKSESYEKIKPVIQINILDFIYFKDIEEYCTKTVTVSKERREYEIETYLQYIYIELPKFRKSKPQMANELECWLALIDNENKEKDRRLLEMAKSRSSMIREAKEEVDEILSENVIKELNWYIQTAKWDEISKMETAEKRGMKKANIENAREMLKLGIDIEKIRQITKLDIEEIEKLKEKVVM